MQERLQRQKISVVIRFPIELSFFIGIVTIFFSFHINVMQLYMFLVRKNGKFLEYLLNNVIYLLL